MKILREFFTLQIFISSLVFALPVGLLILWRAAYIEDIPIISAEAAGLYLSFVFILAVFFILIFFVLFLLGRRKQED